MCFGHLLELLGFIKGRDSTSKAEPWCIACYNTTSYRFDANHPDVAGNLNNLAELYKAQGRYEEAEPLKDGEMKR
jgi:hypothetical protein